MTAEIDAGDGPLIDLPTEWDVLAEVTLDERFTGAALAQSDGPPTLT